MTTILEARRDPNLKIPPEQAEFDAQKAIVAKAVVGSVTYPITFAKVLFQFGYEPYPLDTGRSFIVFGRQGYYMPNVFSYLRNVYNERGLLAMYRGVEAGIASTLIGGFGAYYAEQYLDQHFPQLGGSLVLPGGEDADDEDELSDYEAFRRAVRRAVRGSFSQLVGVTISQPFTVLMIREIAQHIGGDGKYPNVIAGILRVGNDEGPQGLFAGLVPTLLASLVRIWGVAGLSYAINRSLLKLEKNTDDVDQRKSINQSRKYAPWLVPIVVNTFAYPFELCATFLEATGSQVVVSLLPYVPPFSHWSDVHTYLKPYNVVRGSRVFLREHRGPISVGHDHKMYVATSHFA